MLSSVIQHGGERQSQKQRDKQLQALRKDIVPLWDKGIHACHLYSCSGSQEALVETILCSEIHFELEKVRTYEEQQW